MSAGSRETPSLPQFRLQVLKCLSRFIHALRKGGPHISSYILTYLHISSHILRYTHISSYILTYPPPPPCHNVVVSKRNHHKHGAAPLSLYHQRTITKR